MSRAKLGCSLAPELTMASKGGSRKQPDALERASEGRHLLRPGDYKGAIEDHDEATRLSPQDAKAYAGRALVHTLLGEDTKVEQDIRRAVGLGFDRASVEEMIEGARTRR